MNAILSLDLKNNYAKQGDLVFSHRDDLRNFNKCTKGKTIIMGRLTYESLPCKLPMRKHIVISSTVISDVPDVIRIPSWNAVLEYLQRENIQKESCWVIGGASIWREAFEMKLISTVLLTRWFADGSGDQSFAIDRYIDGWSNVIKSTFMGTADITSGPIVPGFQIQQIDRPSEQLNNTNHYEYRSIARDIITNAAPRKTRNATTYSSFGHTLSYDLRDGFPLITSKRVFWRGVLQEFLFFWRGDTDTCVLSDQNINIWKGNTSREFLDKMGLSYPEGMMGPMYGYQFRYYGIPYNGITGKPTTIDRSHSTDQLVQLINGLVQDPYSRRHLITAYNPSQVNEGVLYPCHSITVQFYVDADGSLSMQTYQRSCDLFLGVPFNIASSALMLTAIAGIVSRVPGKMRMVLGDVHVYDTHIDAVKEMLSRNETSLPTVIFDSTECRISSSDTLDTISEKIGKLVDTHFVLSEYNPAPSIKVPMIA